jgi:UDP-2-acetamido-3-amino-2,3-dideoxy-glucuronate N-acetyltransferase
MVKLFHCHWSIDLSSFFHFSVIVDKGATIGAGTRIWHWTHVCAGARIGENCSLGQNVYVGNDVVIGSNVRIQNNVSVYDSVTIEDDVFCGPSMVFTNVLNPRSHVSRKKEYRRTLVKNGATIGANATIVCGHTIGEHAFVGAGAVVTSDVLSFSMMLGVPARHAGWMCICGEQLEGFSRGKTTCKCGRIFQLKNEQCALLDSENV